MPFSADSVYMRLFTPKDEDANVTVEEKILTKDKLLKVLLSEGMDVYVTVLKKWGAYDEISRADTLALEWKRIMENNYREDGVD